MSDKNKARDRDANGRIKRSYTGKYHRMKYDSAPKAWVNCYMTRPRRRVERALCREIAHTQGVERDVAFPLGNHKPHIYYW